MNAATRPRIVVIDDDADFRAVLGVVLRARYDVLSYDCAEAWLDADRNKASPPDLLITDVKMPGASGFKLCETVRSLPRYAAMPILFLTGVGSDEVFLMGQEAGASAYLTKPVEREILLSRIEDLLARNAPPLRRK